LRQNEIDIEKIIAAGHPGRRKNRISDRGRWLSR
jgi:hypothetical protein